MGHVRDLPKSQMGVDIQNDYEPKYITIRGKGSVIKELKTAAKRQKSISCRRPGSRRGSDRLALSTFA